MRNTVLSLFAHHSAKVKVKLSLCLAAYHAVKLYPLLN